MRRAILACLALAACALPSPPTPAPVAQAETWRAGEVIEVWGYHASNWEYVGFYPDGGREPWHARGVDPAGISFIERKTCGSGPQVMRVKLQGVLTVPGSYGHLNSFNRMFLILRISGTEPIDCADFLKRWYASPMF